MLRNHSSRANLVPVLTRSRSGPQAGTRLTNTVTGSLESLKVPSAPTCDTLETQQDVKSITDGFDSEAAQADHMIQTGNST